MIYARKHDLNARLKQSAPFVRCRRYQRLLSIRMTFSLANSGMHRDDMEKRNLLQYQALVSIKKNPLKQTKRLLKLV